MKNYLPIKKMLKSMRECFQLVKEDIKQKKQCPKMPLFNCLLSGLAIFSLKYPSLLKFDSDRNSASLKHNLKHLYNINRVPSDTYMRERLDEIKPDELRRPYKVLFSQVQRSNRLKPFEFMDGHYLMSLDGTGCFSSSTVHCENCCVKKHRDGNVTYYHQMLTGALVHPDLNVVLPFAPEPIVKTDGAKKNDCERNAAKRYIKDFRREHPHLKVIIVEDGLASNAPHIKLLEENNISYILVANESDHKHLFKKFRESSAEELETNIDNETHKFRFTNGLPLNESNPDCIVNVLEYWETTKKGVKHFAWVTDIKLSCENVYQIMRGGRARWKIENETFNTLKNQGYQFEHNFGHGKKNLSTVFAYLMLLAFLIDQIQEHCCKTFKGALRKWKTKSRFWERLRSYFFSFLIDSWDNLLGALDGMHVAKLYLDTS